MANDEEIRLGGIDRSYVLPKSKPTRLCGRCRNPGSQHEVMVRISTPMDTGGLWCAFCWDRYVKEMLRYIDEVNRRG